MFEEKATVRRPQAAKQAGSSNRLFSSNSKLQTIFSRPSLARASSRDRVWAGESSNSPLFPSGTGCQFWGWQCQHYIYANVDTLFWHLWKSYYSTCLYRFLSKIYTSFLFSNESSNPVVPGINGKDGTDAVSSIVYKRNCGQSKAAYPWELLL